MREAEILQRYAALRERHPELAGRLSWSGLQRVLERDEVVVCKLPIREKARMTAMGGVGVLTFNSSLPPREWLFAGAHEYAHWALHSDAEPTRHGYVTYSRDVREPEADYLAEWLLRGPDAKPAPTLRIPWHEQRPVAPPPARRAPLPSPAFDPYAARPVVGVGRRPPRYGALAIGESRVQQAMRLAKKLPRPMRAGPHSEEATVRYERDGVRYIDPEGFRWTLYDVRYSPQRETLSLGNLAAQCRVFVGQTGERRRYAFTRWESRDVAARHLDRQFRDAVRLPMRAHELRQRTVGDSA